MAFTAIIFALSYMVFTGIFIFSDREIPEEFTVPMFRVARIHTEYGDFPWIIAYLDRHTIFSMSTEAMFSTTIISWMVGINSALLAFRFSSASKSHLWFIKRLCWLFWNNSRVFEYICLLRGRNAGCVIWSRHFGSTFSLRFCI